MFDVLQHLKYFWKSWTPKIDADGAPVVLEDKSELFEDKSIQFLCKLYRTWTTRVDTKFNLTATIAGISIKWLLDWTPGSATWETYFRFHTSAVRVSEDNRQVKNSVRQTAIKDDGVLETLDTGQSGGVQWFESLLTLRINIFASSAIHREVEEQCFESVKKTASGGLDV